MTGLFLYPIKGCHGISVPNATIERRGLRNDRRWMLVNAETGVFLSQRSHPVLARLTVSVDESRDLTVAFGDAAGMTIPFLPDEALADRDITVWAFTGGALDTGDETAAFFSEALGIAVRLVRTPEEFTRRINPKYASTTDDAVGFADGYPVLLATEPSLADLNNRLATPVPMNRFRPNIVIAGTFEPWAEDEWTTVRIRDVGFYNAKPCGRCSVTTIDQATGTLTGTEPLATLARFRRDADSNNVNFGANLIPAEISLERPIRVGDPVGVG